MTDEEVDEIWNMVDDEGLRPCYFYLGITGCRNGDGCRFSHDPVFVSEWRNRKSKVAHKRFRDKKKEKALLATVQEEPVIETIIIEPIVHKGCYFYYRYCVTQ